MNITIVGTGYVGLVTGACFAEMGVNVTCVDKDKGKIEVLTDGGIPIYEPGLEELVSKNMTAGRLKFSASLPEAMKDTEVIILAVGTPPDEDGSADLNNVLEVAGEIGEHLERYVLVVNKSTVPVGTASKVEETIKKKLGERGAEIAFDVASNPEFLKEGSAIKDFMTPDRVIVGTNSERAHEIMDRLYRPFMLNNYRVIYMDIPSAEMTKYAANAMLATRISFINEIANLCESVGADINMVRTGIGSDSRIGSKFLYPGVGYGGSCFPKDVKALIHTAKLNGKQLRVLEAVEKVNELQKEVLFEKLIRHFGDDISGKKFAVWGLSFKPETDDVREAPSRVIIDRIISAGGTVSAYDPAAMDEFRKIRADINFSSDMYEACIDASAVLLVTEWKEFRIPSWPTLKRIMASPVIFDGRNIYRRSDVTASGFVYYSI
ncbi:MAG TPA: UDP-glucose/GDP-mannose dehydrogenase family protein [Bacteroidales bacterium]|jgi:UDPglucose 6-dehydrogenase|nr:UDP-glucose/GDP-mannose dehydrogenase family protein [Bacteroidales bacterium]